jgi:hypothetical protein
VVRLADHHLGPAGDEVMADKVEQGAPHLQIRQPEEVGHRGRFDVGILQRLVQPKHGALHDVRRLLDVPQPLVFVVQHSPRQPAQPFAGVLDQPLATGRIARVHAVDPHLQLSGARVGHLVFSHSIRRSADS